MRGKSLVVGLMVSAMMAAVFSGGLMAGSRAYLSGEEAMRGVRACVEMAEEKGWSVSVVVVDRGEDVVASVRMDGALPASYTGAGLKANTSLSWGMTTGEVNEIMEKVPFFKQFPGILGIPGGVPVFAGDTLVGGVGVAGSAPGNDAECAAVAAGGM